MSDSRFEQGIPFSEKDIQDVENAVGRKLPEEYLKFVKAYGGAFVGGFVDGNEDLPILAFLNARGNNGIMRKLDALADLKDEKILPFADCELGNIYVFDKENAVHYIDYYGRRTGGKKVAENFDDFISRINVGDE